MMPKLGTLFLGLTVGGATFLAMGLVCFLTIGQLQYQTPQARATQATEPYQVSTRAKDAPAVVEGDRAELRYVRLMP
jgi:hypothetical protein